MLLDALIIGGGPAGSTTALLLANAGWSVGIVEKKIFPRRKVCGEFISATSFALLQKLNLADFYLSNSGPEVKRVGLFAENSILTSHMPSAHDYPNRWGRAIGREHLDTALLDKAGQVGVKIFQPMQIKNIERSGGVFICTVIGDEKVHKISARTLIHAYGSWEKGPQPINIQTHKPSDLLAFKAHFINSELPTDLISLLAFPGGYGGMVNTDNDRATLSCCIRRDILQEKRLQSPGLQAGEVVLKHISQSCLGIRQVLARAKREGAWLAAGPIRPGIRKCYENDVFFVGNIVGEAHPIIADGISMAMQSAWTLSEILIKHQKEIFSHQNIEDIGRIYTSKWKSHFVNRIYAAAVFANLAMYPWAVKTILPIVKLFPSILTLGAHLSGKINQVIPSPISTKLTANEKENTI